jgi:ABC-type polysaccharide/polyol phosphate export permease
MSIQGVIRKLRINPDFYPLSSLIKLIGVIVTPIVFLAISGRSPERISWYFLSMALPLFLLSFFMGYVGFARTPAVALSINRR